MSDFGQHSKYIHVNLKSQTQRREDTYMWSTFVLANKFIFPLEPQIILLQHYMLSILEITGLKMFQGGLKLDKAAGQVHFGCKRNFFF